jgi:hypothetical protein
VDVSNTIEVEDMRRVAAMGFAPSAGERIRLSAKIDEIEKQPS